MRTYELLSVEPIQAGPGWLAGAPPVLLTGEVGVELLVRSTDGLLTRALVIDPGAAMRVALAGHVEPYDYICAATGVNSEWSKTPGVDVEATVTALLIGAGSDRPGGVATLGFFLHRYAWAEVIWMSDGNLGWTICVKKAARTDQYPSLSIAPAAPMDGLFRNDVK